MTTLLAAMFTAPLIGVNLRYPERLHAVDMDVLPAAWPNRCVSAPCGAKRLRIMKSGDFIVPWPPDSRSLPEGWERCRECWVATGKKRPRSRWSKP